jgi:nucleoside-diphosphate-sugar epimerase
MGQDSMEDFYKNKKVLVTGGASFIGSHLVDSLLALGSKVRVIDDLSSGNLKNLSKSMNSIEFKQFDLRNNEFDSELFKSVDVVFHLAAIHGGRGFIETQQNMMLDNLNIDTNVIKHSQKSGVKMLVHASSACAYPIGLQEKDTNRNLLEESQASMKEVGKAFPDGVYGWTKLIGEYQLETISGNRFKGRSARIFTAYGERENLSHAAIALIAKSVLKMDPFPVWGNGKQTRNFTHVSDTVKGLLFLGSDTRDLDFDVFNIGMSTHFTVNEFIEEIHTQLQWHPSKWDFQLDKPAGVASRASDNSKMEKVFGWEPNVGIREGIKKTIEWYLSNDDNPKTTQALEEKLNSR